MLNTPLSEVLIAQNNEEVWYADASATKHMTDNRTAFINFKEIPKGTWPVAIANEQNLWVQEKEESLRIISLKVSRKRKASFMNFQQPIRRSKMDLSNATTKQL